MGTDSYDFGNYDYFCTVFSSKVVKAKKQHRCSCCRRTINPGESYTKEAGTGDGFWTTKGCSHCTVARAWLEKETQWSFMFSFDTYDDLYGVVERVGTLEAAKLYAGIRMRWVNAAGKLLKVPKMPLTSKEIREKT